MLDGVIIAFFNPEGIAPLEALDHVVNQVHSSFVGESLRGGGVEFGAEVFNLCANLLGGLARVLHFEAGQVEARAVLEESLHKSGVETESGHLHPGSAGPPHVTFTLAEVTLQSAIVSGHLFLRIHIFHLVRCVPPLAARLHVHVVGLQFLNEFLGALSKHRALVASANEVDILSIEAFGQVNKSRLEARISINKNRLLHCYFYLNLTCFRYDHEYWLGGSGHGRTRG